MSIQVLVAKFDGEVDYIGHVGLPTGQFLDGRELHVGDVVCLNETEKNVAYTNVICIDAERITVYGVAGYKLSTLDISHVVIPYDAPTLELNTFLETKELAIENVILDNFFKKYTEEVDTLDLDLFTDIKEGVQQYVLVNDDAYETYGIYGLEVGYTYKGIRLCIGDGVTYIVNQAEMYKGVITLQGNLLKIVWVDKEPNLVEHPTIYINSAKEHSLQKYPYMDISLNKLLDINYSKSV